MQTSSDSTLNSLDLILKVDGMSCTTCATVIDTMLQKNKGITEAKTHFLTDMLHVKYLPHLITPQEILEKISDLGYQASPFEGQREHAKAKRSLLLRLGISAVLMGNIMMISNALYWGFFQDLSQSSIWYLSLPQWILTTPVIFYCGSSIVKRGLAGLCRFQPCMDSLIAVAALSAYGYSIIQMLMGSLHLYFDTTAMLVTLVLLGKYIEAQARHKVSSGILELYSYAGRKVRLWKEGGERWVAVEDVQPGDEFAVHTGERSPLDGRIISGGTTVDEAILTGEARPKKKFPGDDVLGGSLLLDGELRMSTIRTVGDSALGKTIALMEEALGKKIPAEVTADRLVRWLVPSILTLALVTGGYLLYRGTPFDAAMLRALAILVITCPCALGIAIPLAKVAFVRKAHDLGIIVCNPDALEQAKDIHIMVFDKTGTITEGSFTLRAIESIDITQDDLLCSAAAVEAKSGHFLAREVMHKVNAAALKIEEATGFEELRGLGVKATVANRVIAVGNRELMEREHFILPSDLDTKARHYELQGMTIVCAGWEGMVHGFLVFGDRLKTGASQTIKTLKERDIDVWLVSGDSEETTRAVAQMTGIVEFRGQALPFQKVEIIKMLQQSGKKVGMVGDGINDAAALAQADVGIAMLTGTNVALGSADIHLLSSDPVRIMAVMNLSTRTVKAIRQNLFLAFIYNALAIPLAMAGFINPLIAVTAMFASSLTVIGNTLRIAQSKRV